MTLLRLKHCFAALIGSALLAFPHNLIGCGPTEDPYDYYTSFFSKKQLDTQQYRPFYYTALLKFYDDELYETADQQAQDTALLNEWKAYAGANLATTSIAEFVYKFTAADVAQMLGHLTQNKPTTLPVKLTKNAMAAQFLASKNTPALTYLMLAKTIEPFCGGADEWTAPKKGDSLKMNGYLSSFDAQYKAANDPFLKAKYGFLRCKTAFYNRRYTDCVQRYNDAFGNAHLTAAVRPMSLGYMAGSQFKLGNGKAAALAFCRAFAQNRLSQKQDFLGFYWATDGCNPKLEGEYLAACANKAERANMQAMFALYGRSYRTNSLKAVYDLDAKCALLPVMAVREINKLEEQYLTPKLRSQKGSRAFYLSWNEREEAPSPPAELAQMQRYFEDLAKTSPTQYRGLYGTAAAYVAYIGGNDPLARQLLATAQKETNNPSAQAQATMVSLLLEANLTPTIDAAAEQRLLPLLQLLRKQATIDIDYQRFYRSFFSEILAAKYTQQGDVHKAALAYAAADAEVQRASASERWLGSGSNAVDFLQNNMETPQILALYTHLTKPNHSNFEKFLLQASPLTTNVVADVLGTSYLRQFDYENAIVWFKKQPASTAFTTEIYQPKTGKTVMLNVNPFHDYLNDVQRYEKPVAKAFTKLSLSEKMQALEQELNANATPDERSKRYYQLASGYYNLSFYGNAWMAVDYNRHSSNWNSGQYEKTWEAEYYGVKKAASYYKKAYELATNKEFKAAAYFLYIKCLQRQLIRPEYSSKADYDSYEKKLKMFQKQFSRLPQFAQFEKEFGSTQFYKYTYNRCSYLRDFVAKR